VFGVAGVVTGHTEHALARVDDIGQAVGQRLEAPAQSKLTGVGGVVRIVASRACDCLDSRGLQTQAAQVGLVGWRAVRLVQEAGVSLGQLGRVRGKALGRMAPAAVGAVVPRDSKVRWPPGRAGRGRKSPTGSACSDGLHPGGKRRKPPRRTTRASTCQTWCGWTWCARARDAQSRRPAGRGSFRTGYRPAGQSL